MQAYKKLKKVQGILVPELLFLSELRGFSIKFLGLQLGRSPTSADLETRGGKSFELILSYIRSMYGLRHEDSMLRNGRIIRDDKGRDRLVVIDWEDYTTVEIVSKTAPPQIPKNLVCD